MKDDPFAGLCATQQAMRDATRATEDMARFAREAAAPWIPDPSAARAARTLAKRRRWAQELREAGWKVEEPSADQGN